MATQALINPNEYTKEELAAGLLRLRRNATAKINKFKEKGKVITEEAMRIGLSGGSAFAVGWWNGQTAAEPDFNEEEDLQWFGLDRESVIGASLVVLSLTPFVPRGFAGAMRSMGSGVLSYWLGTKGFEIGNKKD
jgi:hypothetical protein